MSKYVQGTYLIVVDLKNRVVTLSPGFRPRRVEIRYDQLVIALGNVTNFLGMPGLQEHGMPFRTLADAVRLRNHVIHALEEAGLQRINLSAHTLDLKQGKQLSKN